MKLNADQSRRHAARKRVGRGIGSGLGKTAGAATRARSPAAALRIKGFEGGQMPLYRRLPKRGFNNIFAKRFATRYQLGRLQGRISMPRKLDEPPKPIDAAALKAAGVIKKKRDGVQTACTRRADRPK